MLREGADQVEQIGIERAWGQIEKADAVVFLHDLTRAASDEYRAADALIAAKLPQAAFISAAAALAPLADRLVAQDDRAGVRGVGASLGPARYTLAADGSGRRVGIISAVSDEFCGGCNRMRLTARSTASAGNLCSMPSCPCKIGRHAWDASPHTTQTWC